MDICENKMILHQFGTAFRYHKGVSAQYTPQIPIRKGGAWFLSSDHAPQSSRILVKVDCPLLNTPANPPPGLPHAPAR